MTANGKGGFHRQSWTRRRFVQAGALAGAGGLLGSGLTGPMLAEAQVPRSCANWPEQPFDWRLRPFLDRLPLPPVLAPTKMADNFDLYDLSAEQFKFRFHKNLPRTPVWGFNGLTPGPTMEVQSKRKVRIRLANNLRSFLLCPDPNVHGTWPEPYITLHLHGLIDRQEFDGGPEDRFPPGVSYTYEIPNIEDEAAAFWYHDHNLGVTRIAVMSGLVGFYLMRTEVERQLNLPRGEFEIPMVIRDVSFNEDGTLWLAFPWQPEFFGQFATVNGKIWPRQKVKRGKYRFRILNGSNARFYNLNLDPEPPLGAFTQIGTDGGLLEMPVELTVPGNTPMDGLLLAPAERADVIIDFDLMRSKYPGLRHVTVVNNAPAPFPDGDPDNTLETIMRFDLSDEEGWTEAIQWQLLPPRRFSPVVRERFMTLVDYGSPVRGYPPPPPDYPYPTLLINNLRYSDPPMATPEVNKTEIWNLINLAPDTHPIHVHQTQFRILSRQNFNLRRYLRRYGVDGPLDDPDIPFTGPPMPPFPFEDGLKDVVRANPNQVVRIEIPFGRFPGRFVWHCHMLDHEDNEMMRTFFSVKD